MTRTREDAQADYDEALKVLTAAREQATHFANELTAFDNADVTSGAATGRDLFELFARDNKAAYKTLTTEVSEAHAMTYMPGAYSSSNDTYADVFGITLVLTKDATAEDINSLTAVLADLYTKYQPEVPNLDFSPVDEPRHVIDLLDHDCGETRSIKVWWNPTTGQAAAIDGRYSRGNIEAEGTLAEVLTICAQRFHF